MALAVLGAVWILVILSFSTLLADPTSGKGEGPPPGQTVTTSGP